MLRGKVMTAKRTGLPANEGLTCSYPHRVCMQNRHQTYEFCIRHILEDKSAPFKQCGFVNPKNGKRCANAAYKLDKKDGSMHGYCNGHARRVSIAQQVATRLKRPADTPTSLIQDLDHYNVVDSYNNPVEDVSKSLTKQALAHLPMQAPANRISQIIDYASDSDSDSELMNVDQAWKGNNESDAESIDSELDDPLKHAGVYTAEEATLITRDKLIRLQSLYIEQFKRLQHVLRERRRKYLQNVKQEKESQLSVYGVPRGTMKEYNQYRRLKFLLRYHRLNGTDLLLHHQSKEKRRAVSEGANYRPPTVPKCTHQDSDKKCGLRVLPCTKYCSKHILDDPLQVLYRPCSGNKDHCPNPVIPVVDLGACRFHCTIPPMPPPVPLENPMCKASTSSSGNGDQLDPHVKNQEVFGLNSSAEVYGNLASNSSAGYLSGLSTAASKDLWNTHLETPESKLREELESIDLTPGDLPPEQLLATN